MIDCGNSAEEIRQALKAAFSSGFRERCLLAGNPYAGENTSAEIVARIKNYLAHEGMDKKRFYDIAFDISNRRP